MTDEHRSAHSGRGARSGPDGFPAGFKSTPVPNPLLSSYLEEIDDLEELKVTLRAIWFMHQRRLFPSSFTMSDLLSDRTTAAMLHASGSELEDLVSKALENAVHRGTLLALQDTDGAARYYLNSEPVRRALETSHPEWERVTPAETYPAAAEPDARPSVFAAYETNIGALTPAIGDRLRDAVSTYPEQWIREAIDAAARANARNWNYIAAVLRGMADEGRPDGKPGPDTDPARSDEHIQRYLDAQRARGNR